MTGQRCDACDACDSSKWDTVVKADGTCVRVHIIGIMSLLVLDRPFAHRFPSKVGDGNSALRRLRTGSRDTHLRILPLPELSWSKLLSFNVWTCLCRKHIQL
jgi:hypothetical protein